MIQIYGSPRSSAGRCFLVLEELGIPYEVRPLDMMGRREHKSEAFLKLNPNGKVPCLIDGDFVIWESMAINSYLADKYRPELLGTTPELRGLVQQWSFWALSELQPPLVDMIIQMMFTPEEKRDPATVAKARERVPPMLAILNGALKSNHLVGDRLTLADFNVAAVVNIAVNMNFDLSPYPAVRNWMELLRARPSFRKFQEMRSSPGN